LQEVCDADDASRQADDKPSPEDAWMAAWGDD
jgi:hypothetical protein